MILLLFGLFNKNNTIILGGFFAKWFDENCLMLIKRSTFLVFSNLVFWLFNGFGNKEELISFLIIALPKGITKVKQIDIKNNC